MPSANESEFQIQTRNGRIFSHAPEMAGRNAEAERVRRAARAEVEALILGTRPDAGI
ncbi:MAG: hypothetical protein QG637_1183 [Chloroflexota bacterium]|nr:hypothetical protein [Chloroflexota bacterium]